MTSKAPANIDINIGNVNLGPGATATLGMNSICSDSKAQGKTIEQYKDALFISEPSSVRAELLNIKGSLTEGTCRWIQQNETYRSWLLAQDSKLLWISGGPGRGKTMLSIFLTQEWESLPGCVFYVFCGDKFTSDEVTIMRSLLYQVLDQVPSMAEHVRDCLGTEERIKRSLSSRGDLWAMFRRMLEDPKLGPVLGLIDGLDECHWNSTSWLLNNLRQVFDKESRSRLSPSNPFKLAIVSRDMVGLKIYPRLNLETKTDAVEKDVTLVINAKMKEHVRFSKLDDDFIAEIKATLQHRSGGTFLWVGFAIQELLSVETKTEMRLALHAIPRDLGALYSKILLRIKGPMKEKIAQLLHWVILTRQYLTASELARALDVDAQTILDLVAMSGSLLTLSKHQRWVASASSFHGLYGKSSGSKVVKLIHGSVSDFFEGDANEDILPPPEFRINIEEMELQITEGCLRELEALFSRCSLQQYDIPYDTFSWYAILHWPEHARRCGDRLETLLGSGTAFFQSDCGSLIRSRWWHVYKWQGPYHLVVKSRGVSPLHVCSALGLLSLAKRLLQDTALTGNRVDNPDWRGWTALCYALDCGHREVAQLLLDYGASLTRDAYERNTWNGPFERFKPIHKMMELGAEVAEPFLVKTLEGINSNPMTRWRWFRDTDLEHSLFRKAAKIGDERLIRILIANRATLDSHVARLALEDVLESKPEPALIELLLQHTASTFNLDPNLVLKGDARTVYDRVKKFLHHGMNPNSSRKWCSLLSKAVAKFGLDLAELLLDYGADINAVDYHGRSALFFAFYGKGIDNATMLLNRGADLTITDKLGRTALRPAVWSGNAKGVELLLQRGLDANIRDEYGRTPLSWVLSRWNLSVAEMLLKYGANVDAIDKDCRGGGNSHHELGKAIEAHDTCIQPTSLLKAVWGGSVQVVRLLLRHGVDANAQTDELVPTIPLRVAILKRHADMVQVLLEYRADPNREIGRLGTPLDWNQQFDDEERALITKMLLQRGGVYSRGRRRRGTRLRHAFTSA